MSLLRTRGIGADAGAEVLFANVELEFERAPSVTPSNFR